MVAPGKLYGVGVGPGDPELITIKGLKAIEAADVIAYHQARDKKSNALTIAEGWLKEGQKLLPLVYPMTTEALPAGENYETILTDFYEDITAELRRFLDQGKNIVVLAEGDPLFYSSFMYIYDRLAQAYETHVIAGVTSISGAAAALGAPLCYRNQSFTVLSAVLDEAQLKQRLAVGGAFAILKLGRNLDKVRTALRATGLLADALYIERATMENQQIIPLQNVVSDRSPYFSLILVPGKKWGEACA